MNKELRFYMGGYVDNIFTSIETCVSTFNRETGESPNKICMCYKMFDRLRVLANMNGIKLSRGNNTPATILGMRVNINNTLDNNEIVLIKEDNMKTNLTIDRDRVFTFGVDWFKPAVTLPKKYIINKGATVLFWEDGSKTVVKRGKDDEYNKVLGFLWAYFQKTSGLSKTKANKYLADLVDEDDIKLMEMLKNKEINKSMSEVANNISNAFKTILALDNINKK